MSLITINLSFYNQEDILKKHVLGWKSWSNAILNNYSFCIIDDCSKRVATEVLKDIDLSRLILMVVEFN